MLLIFTPLLLNLYGSVLLKQNTLKSPNLSLEWRFPFLKSYPSICFLLLCLLAAVWTLSALISPGILSWHFPGLVCPIPGQMCNVVWDQPCPGAPKLQLLLWPGPVQVPFPGWQLSYALETDSWILPFPMGIPEGGDVLISAICSTCSVGWTVYLGDVHCLYFSPTICATESPEKLLLAWKSGHLSVKMGGATWLQVVQDVQSNSGWLLLGQLMVLPKSFAPFDSINYSFLTGSFSPAEVSFLF